MSGGCVEGAVYELGSGILEGTDDATLQRYGVSDDDAFAVGLTCGGILDVFPPTEEHPLRVEFWGDDVEEIRSFSVADQRTHELVDRLWAPPCRELLITDEVRERAKVLAEQLPGVADMLHKVGEGIAVEGMESLTPALIGDEAMQLLTDLLPPLLVVRASDVPTYVQHGAADLGVAFQVTNFLRDVGEDLDRGRVYLPRDELAAFGVDRDLLAHGRASGRPDPRARRALAHLVEIGRAHV